MGTHEERAWRRKVVEEKFADPEGDGYEVVIELRRSRVPAASLVFRRRTALV